MKESSAQEQLNHDDDGDPKQRKHLNSEDDSESKIRDFSGGFKKQKLCEEELIEKQ